MARRKSNHNIIQDNRGQRKTIHVSSRRKNSQKMAKINVILAVSVSVFVLLVLAVTVSVVIRNRSAVSSNAVNSGNEEIESFIIGQNTEADLEDNDQEEMAEEMLLAEDGFITNITPTSCTLNWDAVAGRNYKVCYQVVNSNSETHGKASREDRSLMMDEICSAYNDNSGDLYLTRDVLGNNYTITGLVTGNEYDVMIIDDTGAIVSENIVRTSSAGYCDPFKAVDSIFTFAKRDEETGQIQEIVDNETVVMTASEGCLGVEARNVFETAYYSDADLKSKIGTLPLGTVLFITEDENGNYCYLNSAGEYSVHVSDEGNKAGWVDARKLMVDAAKIYKPENPIYGIQINRTNAYSSIFTTGGDPLNVDDNEDPASRYNPLTGNTVSHDAIEEASEESVEEIQEEVSENVVSANSVKRKSSVEGRNIIDGITGEKLPNYGSTDKMPVIWDLALELKQCQKNALENGYSILIYEGYRPAATSLAVYTNLSNQGYLGVNVNGLTLAQGALTDQVYTVSYYIARQSRHNKGVAVDLTLQAFESPDELGEEAVMQTKMHTLDYRCNMHYNTWEADLLTDIMIGHGSNLEYIRVRSEWWHFQLNNDKKELYPLIKDYTFMDFEF